jgi:anti-sigma B factor antagonist
VTENPFDEVLLDGLMAVEPLHVHSELGREWALLSVHGELDIMTSPDLEAILEALIRRGRREIAVDVAGVRFVDAQGLGVLARSARSLAGRGALIVACPSRSFRRLWGITGLDEGIEVRDQRPTVTGFHAPLQY